MNKTEHDLVQVCVRPACQEIITELTIGSIAEQNPSLDVSVDPARGAVIRGASEADLRLALNLIERFHPDLEIGPLQIVHRISVMNSIEIDYTHKKHIGAEGEFARVKVNGHRMKLARAFDSSRTSSATRCRTYTYRASKRVCCRPYNPVNLLTFQR